MSKHPIYVDFESKQMTYRRKHSGLRKEALARALGLKKNKKWKNEFEIFIKFKLYAFKKINDNMFF